MGVSIPGYKSLPLPVLIDNEFDISIRVSDLPLAVDNIEMEGFKLADPTIGREGEVIKLQGLLGVNIIQFITKMEKIRCLNGTAWLLSTGIVPFGNVKHFLKPDQLTSVESNASLVQNTCINFIDAVDCFGKSETSSQVNFVMEPKKTYFSPLEDTFTDSSVEHGLENMFSLESIGCYDQEESQSKYDKMKIEDFKSKIEFKESKYHVALPWHENVKEVPSNEGIAIAVLNKVVKKLKKDGLLESYQNVFKKQLEENIIERIDVSPENFHKHVWVPHRPVIKTEPNSTTKIRPVFNCSLKTDNKPSLNEAAYAGVNLMNDLTKLALYFRSNKYVMLSDIKQAFLQIQLANDADKNRFSFFMKENDNLVAYRY